MCKLNGSNRTVDIVGTNSANSLHHWFHDVHVQFGSKLDVGEHGWDAPHDTVAKLRSHRKRRIVADLGL